MPNYLVNKQPQSGGEHEVHATTCGHLPAPVNQHSLGWFAGCREAVDAAKKIFSNVDGCYWCAGPCHTR